VALLLELGADPNASTTAGSSTALHRAAYMGHGAIVQLLLAGRANPTLQDADGQTALHKAIQQGHTEVAAALLIACPELAAVRDNRQRLAADMADDGSRAHL
jgi:ankyrin repeat protein